MKNVISLFSFWRKKQILAVFLLISTTLMGLKGSELLIDYIYDVPDASLPRHSDINMGSAVIADCSVTSYAAVRGLRSFDLAKSNICLK